jgi:Bacterial RNA polymerase, alpha chain C terminal domain
MFLSTISRFALWEPEAAANLDEQYLPPEVKQALPVSLGLLDGLSTAQLPDAARLCIGNFLESHNFGLECSALGRRASGLVEIESHILKTPVTVLELSVRASNCLDKASVTTIGELILLSPDNLIDMPSMGKKTRDEIVESLNKIGIPCPPDNLPFSSRLIWNGSGINSFPLATLLSIEESVSSPDTEQLLARVAGCFSQTWFRIHGAKSKKPLN